MTLPKKGDTYRNRTGTVRVTFRPDWDAANPWITYSHGTAGRHVHSSGAARTLFRDPLDYFTPASPAYLMPGAFKLVDIDAQPDNEGKYGYTLEWRRPDGTFRAQCFRSDPEQTRTNMRESGYIEYKETDK